ncbi:RNA polymerase-associated protein RapA [Planctomycetes bacterium CA13]|uniref:RNA polymerase-associated protein RapA n=1 Tax=Novipirellula herctigrandis TaxID=2527986 RepID=A0A5C5Z0F5_9BACT|nr:RNA polymerase-associated protein RapA [Planctomycetes bacterium CA13]
MPEIEDLELLMHGVQALRRRVEQLSCPISGASGIRAQFYPHQVQNVQRILSSARIHHLIADEVGMGKTIQALMVANALRLQIGKLRVRIVVPRAELQSQWIEEIAWRAQCTAELGDEMVGEDWFDVVDDSAMVKPSETLSPDTFDLLILDEPQSLKQDTLRFVAANSADFPRLLLLTASPNLRDMRRFLELLQILEPERIERARREADGDANHEDLDWTRSRIGDLSDAALRLVQQQFENHSANVTNGTLDTAIVPEGVSEQYSSFAEFRRVRVLADTRWKYRNVLRSYRTDFPDHLPRRHPKRMIVEPTNAERDRMRAASSYVGEFLEEHHEPQHLQAASSLLQRSSLGGQSLQDRLTRLRRGEAEHEPRLVKMSELSRRENADSRLDCLVDWLVRFWQEDPTRKVVLAAEDNVTVEELADELSWRVPRVGPRERRVRLKTVIATDDRRVSDDGDEELDSQTLRNLAGSKLREFEESDAQLLIAHHAYRQSYNLQAADALIFYSLPWKPEDVDQWIGRVDRLGREFVDPERPNSRPKPIRILTLHRQGDPTIGVQEVLDEYRIFETAIDPERRLLEEISTSINAKTLPEAISTGTGAGQMLFEFDTEGDEVEDVPRRSGREKETAVPSGSRWTVENAIRLHQQVARRKDLGPILRQNRSLGYVTSPSEEALSRWVNMLRNHKWINIVTFRGEKQADGRRSRTFYTLGQSKTAKLKLDSVQDKKHPFPPFFIARGNIQRPPRIEVETGTDHDGNLRHETLQFLSFGSPLHKDLVQTFERAGKNAEPLGMTVYALGQRHYPKGTELDRGSYLCGVGFVDPAAEYDSANITEVLLHDLPEKSGTRREFMRGRVLANLKAGLESDERFVRLQRPPFLASLAWRLGQGNRMEPCDEQIAADLFGADWHKKERPNIQNKPLPADYIKQLPSFCIGQIAQTTKSTWAIGLDAAIEAFEERSEVIRIESEDRLLALRAAVHEIENEIAQREENASEANQQAIAANYRPRLLQFLEELQLTERSRDMRLQLLERSLDHLSNPGQAKVVLQCTAVIEMEDDPVPIPEESVDGDEASPTASEFATASPPQQESTTTDKPNKPR